MNHPKEFVKGGLTLDEAKEHCRNPETSSKSCTSQEGLQRTQNKGPWFDGYDEE